MLFRSLVQILTEPKNALVRQYKKLFELEGCELGFTPGALQQIAHRAKEKDTGARGLRSMIEDLMLDLLYDLPEQERGRKFIVDEEMLLHRRPVRPAAAPAKRREIA